jgi:methylated-DNA-protein-cysteine methyltransferase-like protein
MKRSSPRKQKVASAGSARHLSSTASERARAIEEVVRAIPRGRVVTYGQVAELAGIVNGHRIVARFMRGCPERLPWQRVVGKKDARRAKIALVEPEHIALQRKLLEKERIRFDAGGFIALAKYGWLPV